MLDDPCAEESEMETGPCCGADVTNADGEFCNSTAGQMLKRVGLRPTRQRLSLARLMFARGNRHITAEHLHGEALAEDVKVSLATVYNTLHQFTAAGLLREVVVDAGRSYFDTNVSEHHHFYSEVSGCLMDIPADEVVVRDLPTAPPGMKIARVDVIVRLTRDDQPLD